MRLIKASANALPLDDESVQTVVTSPPYWGLRQYAGEQQQVWGGDPEHAHEWGDERVAKRQTTPTAYGGRFGEAGGAGRVEIPTERITVEASTGALCPCGAWYGALGLEPTPELYVAHMVEVFREVRRVLRDDGTLWLNLGDSYAGGRSGPNGVNGEMADREVAKHRGMLGITKQAEGLKNKDLVGIPWMVAFALRADGWYLRSDIIWAKPNPMPESVTDRPTKAHEYLFLLSKSQRYYYDADAICEPAEWARWGAQTVEKAYRGIKPVDMDTLDERREAGRNKRTVWTVATRPYSGAHFATYPPDLIEPCILAGSAVGDTVLDPFNGSGTTGVVAVRHNREYVGVDISDEYLALARQRIDGIQHTLMEEPA